MDRLHYPTLIINCVKWFMNNNSEHLPNAQNKPYSVLTSALQGLSHLIIIIPYKYSYDPHVTAVEMET